MSKILKEQNDGIKKAAILLMSLGPEASASVLRHLPENTIQRITYEIANLKQIEPSVSDKVTKEFMELVSKRRFNMDGGLDYAKNLLNKALGAQRAQGIIETLSQMAHNEKPFSIARKADSHHLSTLLVHEQPQTIALVLCYLQPDKSAQVLSELPDELQTEVAHRIASIHSTSPAVVKKIEEVLESKLSNVVDNEMESVGGVKSLVDILNAADRGTEKRILDELGVDHPELVEQIRANLFVFEDIVTLDRSAIQRVLREVNNEDLTLAMKGASTEVASIIFNNVSKRAAETLKDDIEFLGPVRLSMVEDAQKKIVGHIRRLEESGEIILGRADEDAIIL